MKKLILSAIAITTICFFTACTKDYNCVCRDNNGKVQSSATIHGTYSEAKARCGDIPNYGGTCSVE